MSGSSGFSLVELLVVAALLAIVSAATYAGLAAGVRVWRRVEASVTELNVAIGWRRFRKDLTNRLAYRAIPISGRSEELSFPGLVTVTDAAGLAHEEVGRIRYRRDGAGRSLCREEVTYTDLIKGRTPDCRPVISSVEGLAFEYYGLDAAKGGRGGWYEAWEGAESPLAVRMAIAVGEPGAHDARERQYTVVLP